MNRYNFRDEGELSILVQVRMSQMFRILTNSLVSKMKFLELCLDDVLEFRTYGCQSLDTIRLHPVRDRNEVGATDKNI